MKMNPTLCISNMKTQIYYNMLKTSNCEAISLSCHRTPFFPQDGIHGNEPLSYGLVFMPIKALFLSVFWIKINFISRYDTFPCPDRIIYLLCPFRHP